MECCAMYRLDRDGIGRMCSRLITAVGLIFMMTLASAPVIAADNKKTEALAEINGDVITGADLERSLGTKLSTLEEQIYTLKRDELESLIAQRLLAQEATRRGISVPALV